MWRPMKCVPRVSLLIATQFEVTVCMDPGKDKLLELDDESDKELDALLNLDFSGSKRPRESDDESELGQSAKRSLSYSQSSTEESFTYESVSDAESEDLYSIEVLYNIMKMYTEYMSHNNAIDQETVALFRPKVIDYAMELISVVLQNDEGKDLEMFGRHIWDLFGITSFEHMVKSNISARMKVILDSTYVLKLMMDQFSVDDPKMTGELNAVFATIMEAGRAFEHFAGSCRIRNGAQHYTPEQFDSFLAAHISVDTGISIEKAAKVSPMTDMMNYIYKRAHTMAYARIGENLYKQVMLENNQKTYAWEFSGRSVEDFVRDEFQKSNPAGYTLAMKNVGGIKSAIEYICKAKTGVTELPVLKRDRGVFSFSNGVYFTEFDSFVPYTDGGVFYPIGHKLEGQVPVACRFIDQKFNDYPEFVDNNIWKIPTPNVDKIFRDQGFIVPWTQDAFSKHHYYMYKKSMKRGQPRLSYEQFCDEVIPEMWDNKDPTNRTTHDVAWALIGRFLYWMKHKHRFEEADGSTTLISENWEVTLCCYGLRKTGKTKMIEGVVGKFYEMSDIGVLQDNGREIQGLEDLDSKMIVIAPDITDRFWLPRGVFQAMNDGANVKISGMYKKDYDTKWRVPIGLAFNVNPWNDPNDSIGRRQAILRFSKQVPEDDIDPHLDQKLERNISNIILKANRYYRRFVRLYGDKQFWHFCGAQFMDSRTTMQANANPWENFIASERVDLGPTETHYVPLSDVQQAFKSFVRRTMSSDMVKSIQTTEDAYISTFSRKGLLVKRVSRDDNLQYPSEERNQIHGKTIRPIHPGVQVVFGMDLAPDYSKM